MLLFDPIMKKLDKEQKLIWKYSSRISLPGPPNRDNSWLQVKQRITISDQKTERKFSLPTKHMISWRPQITYAVALTVMVILFIPFVHQYFNTEHIITDAGELDKKVLLTDGSTIRLNAKSRLSYKKDFNGDHRKVQLSGEAYFDVQKGPLPFIISTELAEIQVLGTLFNVRARRDGLEVGVNQGSVQIKNNDQSIILEEGEMTIVDPNNISTIPAMPSYKDYPDWLNNKLVCEKMPLTNVCGEIERTFNIEIKFSEPALQEITVTGVIDIDTKNLNSVLSTISLLTQREFKFDGDTCTIL